MLNIKNTYFGFTDNKKPMQAARIHDTLDKLWRFDGEVLSMKEYVYKKLQEGSKPAYKENYTYYSKRLDDYTKPKTLYMIEHANNSYTEVTKTAYLFALHLLDNGLLDERKAMKFIQNEIKEKEEKERLEQERIKKEREEQEKQRLLEEQKRREEYAIRQKQWLANGKELLDSLGYDPITEVLNNHWEEITSLYGEQNYEDTYNHLLQMLGNKDVAISRLQYFVENEKQTDDFYKREYTIQSNPSMTLEKEVLFNTFKTVSIEDENRTITAKVKAVYENREYKGGQQVKQHEFYYLEVDPETRLRSFQLDYGQKINIDDIVCYLQTTDDNKYKLIEAKTGMSLGGIYTNKNKAIQETKEKVLRNIDRVKQLIDKQIEIHGTTPLYQEQAV